MLPNKTQSIINQRFLIRWIGLILLSVLISVNSSCGLLRPSSQKKVEKKQAEAQKQADKEYEKARESHIKKQNKETRKMMKRTKKKAESVNKYKKRNTFFLFRKKCY